MSAGARLIAGCSRERRRNHLRRRQAREPPRQALQPGAAPAAGRALPRLHLSAAGHRPLPPQRQRADMVGLLRTRVLGAALLGFARPDDADIPDRRDPVPAARLSHRASHPAHLRHHPDPDHGGGDPALFHRDPDPHLCLDGPARPQRPGEQAADRAGRPQRTCPASVQPRHGPARHDGGAAADHGAQHLFQRVAPRCGAAARRAGFRRRADRHLLAHPAATHPAGNGGGLPARLRGRARLLHHADPARRAG